MSKIRWSLLALCALLSFACVFSILRLNAANPASGVISPTSAPLRWDGVAAGGTSNGEDTCIEGVNCDTFLLTVSGTPADWAGKRVDVGVTWVVLASDYDLYIRKCPDGSPTVSGCNAGPLVRSSTGGPPSTSERASIEAGNLNANGTTSFSVRVVYFAATAGDQYQGSATAVTDEGTPPPPPPVSTDWHISYHGTCCEGNLGTSGGDTYVLLPVLVQGNKIRKSSDGGRTWREIYPPAPASVPFGIEGDMQAFGDDVIFFGTELATAVVAKSDDRGASFTVVQVPVASGGNDQAWSYLGPFSGMRPGVPAPNDENYVLAGWFRIGSAAIFSFDGGLTWPIQTPLVGNNGSGPEHVVCHSNAMPPPAVNPGDTRIQNPLFLKQKAGRHGAWGTDRKFYWSETVEGTIYVCQTNDFGVNWTGNKHPVAPGPAAGFVVTHSAFDNNGTLYVVHGNKLYVSFNQGKTFAFTHTLPRYGSAQRSDSGADQFFVVECGTIHLAVLADGGEGTGHVYYLRGTGVDTGTPVWEEELVDVVGNVRLDFMQIVVNGNGIPTISYTTPIQQVTTASRKTPKAVLPGSTCPLSALTAVSRKAHGSAGSFDINLPILGTPGVECRDPGATGGHQVVVTFSAPVTFASASASAGTVASAGVVGNTIVINLTNVPDARTITINLTSVSDGARTANISIPMTVLLGDTTGNGAVNSSDVGEAKAISGQPVDAMNFRADVTVNGLVNSSDVGLIKSRSGTTVTSDSASKRAK
ncbi:hypothetical protein BH20VER1_BH20VER1_15550 [soil metagenome]